MLGVGCRTGPRGVTTSALGPLALATFRALGPALGGLGASARAVGATGGDVAPPGGRWEATWPIRPRWGALADRAKRDRSERISDPIHKLYCGYFARLCWSERCARRKPGSQHACYVRFHPHCGRWVGARVFAPPLGVLHSLCACACPRVARPVAVAQPLRPGRFLSPPAGSPPARLPVRPRWRPGTP